ncbi:hypothetical protein B0I35DRAFT_482081 [Stachybotrys elegans]|uniref:Tyrosinase copper-binding domain-containing protein n=1 Tax=Stachybotrys elegans TaxID=80388 RepID=A0A8K0SIZ5_9HYPO|nr:hypothetical protein B0I35DRAFT_482081 [Stachybotrys elegans]
MKASILLLAATTAAAASLPARHTSEQHFAHVPFEEAVEKYSKLFSFDTPAENATTLAAAATCSRPLDVRVEWQKMTTTDQQDWLAAVNCLMDAPSRTTPGQSLWEDLNNIHRSRVTNIHGRDRFFPWHREFVKVYENLLRGDCGYQGPLPWWDETLDAGSFSQSSIFSPDTFGSLPLGPDSTCVTDGAFAGRTFGEVGCLARAGDNEISAEITEDYINLCNTASDFHGFAECNERGVHDSGHEAVGATLRVSETAPLEPLFFLHHTFVDRVWWLWQNQDPSRFTDILGCTIPVFPCPSEFYIMTPESFMGDWDGFSEAEVIGDALDTRSERLCYTYDR